MIRALLCLALVALSGCAGTAAYSVKPFWEPNTQKMVCCEASVLSRKDIASVTVDVNKTGDDYQIHFSETGISATAPIAAAGVTASAIAGAVSNVAVSAAKFSLKP